MGHQGEDLRRYFPMTSSAPGGSIVNDLTTSA
jgi:hypothetical protein